MRSHTDLLYRATEKKLDTLLLQHMPVCTAGLIIKPVVDFLLAIIELFFAKCKGWGVTSEYRLEIAVFEARGSVWPKISGRRGRPSPAFLRVGILVEWSFIRCKNVGRTFVRFVTTHNTRVWRTDGRTDWPLTIAKNALHSMQRGKNWSKCDCFWTVSYTHLTLPTIYSV